MQARWSCSDCCNGRHTVLTSRKHPDAQTPALKGPAGFSPLTNILSQQYSRSSSRGSSGLSAKRRGESEHAATQRQSELRQRHVVDRQQPPLHAYHQQQSQQHRPAQQQADTSAAAWWQPLRTAYAALQRALRIQPSRQHDAEIFAIAGPALLGLAADPLLSLVDTAYVGRLGPAELGALGINTSLFAFAFVVFQFLATATTPLVAAALAAGNKQQAGRITLQALVIATVLGTGVAAGLICCADPVLASMGADPSTGALYQYSHHYLVIRATAAPAALILTVGQGAFRGMLDTRTPLMITLGANAVNLALDPFLIWTAGWGVGGAAAATAAAEWTAAAAYLFCMWRQRGELGLWPLPRSSLADAGENFLPFVRAGGAMAMRSTLLLGTKTLASATATRLGTVPIAAHQVLMQLWMLSSFLVDSLAVGGQTLVAVHLGQQRPETARAIADRLLELGLGLGTLIAILYTASVPLLPGLFTSDAGVTGTLTPLLPLVIGMLPVNSLVYVLDGVLVGSNDFQFLAGAMALTASATVGVLATVEPSHSGLPGVWFGLSFLSMVRLMTLTWRFQQADGPLPPLPPPMQQPDQLISGIAKPDADSPLHAAGVNSSVSSADSDCLASLDDPPLSSAEPPADQLASHYQPVHKRSQSRSGSQAVQHDRASSQQPPSAASAAANNIVPQHRRKLQADAMQAKKVLHK